MNAGTPQLWVGALLSSALGVALAAAEPLELPQFSEPAPRAIPVEETSASFRHVGDFLLYSRMKITDGSPQLIPIKPLRLRAFTDGITVRIETEGEEVGHNTYEIYRADGIGRQSEESGALEVIPGVQASSLRGGVLRHLRLSKESLTLTVFPGVSNQTIVSNARAVSGTTPENPPLSQEPRS